ncbi:MAG: hypothetical protein KJO55_03345 [Gammaproteobacteria bacterium]|nr:hypothetical protein [Gammaproteobacteria bacterium]NND59965.1 hypothetical protein [Gammaproteobacteria bacterium]
MTIYTLVGLVALTLTSPAVASDYASLRITFVIAPLPVTSVVAVPPVGADACRLANGWRLVKVNASTLPPLQPCRPQSESHSEPLRLLISPE